MIEVRDAQKKDEAQLIAMIADFRVELAALKQRPCEPNLDRAAAELADYRASGYHIAVAVLETSELIGFIVARVEGDVVWAESLYVYPEHRRLGAASELYTRVEAIARELGSDTVYNWIHPNNQAMVGFLRSRGYDVLNLIEVRRRLPNEHVSGSIQVGSERFRY